MNHSVRSLLFPLLLCSLLLGATTAWSAGPTFNILDYGATANGQAPVTEAIRSAIAAAKAAGGGTVWVPAGKYTTGPIQLASNLTLHIDAGASLRFVQAPVMPVWKGRIEGTEAITPTPLISGDHVQNVAITGRGTVLTSPEDWRRGSGPPNRGAFTGVLERLSRGEVVPEEEYRRAAPSFRPVAIGFMESNNVLIDGIHIVGSPFWAIQIIYSEKVIIRNAIVETYETPGRDGIDIDSCRDVIIANCYLDTGDDSICLKSGRDADGLRVNRPTENVTITNCVVHHGHGAVAIGSETSGGIRNVVASNISCKGTEKGVRIKSTRGRGGIIENLRFSNWTMEDVGTGIHVTNYYGQSSREPVSNRTPVFRNIAISNMTIRNSPIAIDIEGLPEMPVEGLRISDVVAFAKIGMRAYNTVGLKLSNIEVNPETGPAFMVADSKDLDLQDVTSRKPLADFPVIRLDATPGALVRESRAFAGTGTFLSVEPGALKDLSLVGNILTAAKKPTEEKTADYWRTFGPVSTSSVAPVAGGASGKWEAVILTVVGGTLDTTFNFQVDGSKLTGTVGTPNGEARQISDGRIDGAHISFSVVEQIRGTERKTDYRGIIAGDRIDFASLLAMPNAAALGRRAEPPLLFTAMRAK